MGSGPLFEHKKPLLGKHLEADPCLPRAARRGGIARDLAAETARLFLKPAVFGVRREVAPDRDEVLSARQQLFRLCHAERVARPVPGILARQTVPELDRRRQ